MSFLEVRILFGSRSLSVRVTEYYGALSVSSSFHFLLTDLFRLSCHNYVIFQDFMFCFLDFTGFYRLSFFLEGDFNRFLPGFYFL